MFLIFTRKKFISMYSYRLFLLGGKEKGNLVSLLNVALTLISKHVEFTILFVP